MLEVCVCIGTACHLRGAESVVDRLQQVIAERELGDKVQLRGSFCLDHCSDGVSVRVGDTFLSVLPDRVDTQLMAEIENQLTAIV